MLVYSFYVKGRVGPTWPWPENSSIHSRYVKMSHNATWWEDDIFHGQKTKVSSAVTLGRAPTLLWNAAQEQRRKQWPSLVIISSSCPEVPALPTWVWVRLFHSDSSERSSTADWTDTSLQWWLRGGGGALRDTRTSRVARLWWYDGAL